MSPTKISGLPTWTVTTDDYIVFVDQADNTTKKAPVSGLPVGSGDVVWPASSTDNAVARYDSTTGKIIQNSGVTISDENNIYVNNFFGALQSTVSAGGTTILTVGSARSQTLTGSTTQTFQLPDATTLPLTAIFDFNNNSASSLFIKNAGGTTLYTVPAGGVVNSSVIVNTTANGTWDFSAQAPASVTWGSGITGLVMNSVLSTSPSIASWASSSTVPAFIPQRGTANTGIGGDSTHVYAIVGGVARATVSASGITTSNIELGNTTDTTVSRVSAGVIAVEGVTIPSISSTDTLTNKRITKRLVSTTQSATPAINTNNGDIFTITGLAQAITSFTTNLTGTPVEWDLIMIQITDNGTARAITWGASFTATTVALPTTTVISTKLRVLFQWNWSTWSCIASV